MRKLFFLLTPLFFFSCKQESVVPKGVLKQSRMQELVWDMMRADAFVTSFAGKGDTAFNQLKESVKVYREVFAIHKTNKDEFKKSLEWYQRHPEAMKVILDSLQIRQRRVMEQRSKPASTYPPDTLKV